MGAPNTTTRFDSAEFEQVMRRIERVAGKLVKTKAGLDKLEDDELWIFSAGTLPKALRAIETFADWAAKSLERAEDGSPFTESSRKSDG